MKSAAISKLLRLKRAARNLTNDNTFNITYLIRDEGPIRVDHEAVGQYSSDTLVECFDPRNGLRLGHFFNPRYEFMLHNIVVEPIQGLVYNLSGDFLAESTTWPIFQLYSAFPWKPGNKFHPKEVRPAILVTSNRYGHWLLEDLGATLFLIEKYPDALILASKLAPKYVHDLLILLNREVKFLNGPTILENLHFITKSQDSGWMHPQDISSIRNSTFIKPYLVNTPPTIPVYASRRGLKRSPSNEKDIESHFRSLGFEIAELHDMNFFDEISMLSQAKSLVSFHGSAHLNAIFMQEQGHIFDLVNENYWTELHHRLVDLRNQSYHFFTYPGNLSDEVDISKLTEFMKNTPY